MKDIIPFLDLKAQYNSIKTDIDEAVKGVLASSAYVLGPEVTNFEREFAIFQKVKHGVAVNSGTSALHLALLAAGVGPGDEVITVSDDGKAMVWSAQNGRKKRDALSAKTPLLVVSRTEKHYRIGGTNQLLTYELATHQKVTELPTDGDWVTAVPEKEGRGPGEAHAAPLGNDGRDDGVDAPLLVYSLPLALEDLAQAHARQEVGEVRRLLKFARQRGVAVGDPPLGGQLDLFLLPGLDLVPVQVPGLDDLLHGGVSGQPPGAGLRLVCLTTLFLR